MPTYKPCPGSGKPSGESVYIPGKAVCPHCTKHMAGSPGDKTPRHKETSGFRRVKH